MNTNLSLTPEHDKRNSNGELHPETMAAYSYVDSVLKTADYQSPYAWHGWALREAFLAGCSHAVTAQPVTETGGAVEGEPAAWMYQDEPCFDGSEWHEHWKATTYEKLARFKSDGKEPIPLYRHPISQPVAKEPTFIEIMQLADNYFSFRGNGHGGSFFATDIQAKSDPGKSLQDLVRAVLIRWGQPTSQPVAEDARDLVTLLALGGDCGGGAKLSPEQCRRAATLLQQQAQAPKPIPVSERPWEREGWCDAERTCWAIGQRECWNRVYVPGRDWSNPTYTHLLPHWALPVPANQGN